MDQDDLTTYQKWERARSFWRRQKQSQKHQNLYPFLIEKHRTDIDGNAIFLSLIILVLVGIAIRFVFFPYGRSPGSGEYVALELADNATPTAISVVVSVQTATAAAIAIHPTSTPGPTATEFAGQELAEGYTKQVILARFSNYWPDYGGTNCQGDCELFADGTRKDRAVAEGLFVVACPPELLLGTRIEYPPNSGLVWTCRDRGGDIIFYYSENGTPIYWLDFMSQQAWVDFGSYIQVQVWVPENQTLP